MQIQNSSTFSIVVPLFNEEENVKHLIKAVLEAVGTNENFLEIILVDDGSADATASLALELAGQDGRIRLVRHKNNQGLGGAIRTGLNAAQGDFVLYTDADLPFDFKLIPQLLSIANEDSVVSGYRLNRGEGGRRWILTKGYNFLIWLLFGLSLRDVNFACKIFPKHFLQNAEFHSLGSFIDVEILLESRRFGLEIIEHPLVYYPRERGLSTLSRPEVVLFILKEMFAYTTKFFSEQNALSGFLRFSPLAKLIICSASAFISVIFLFERVWTYPEAAQLLLTIGAGITSLLFGWRTGLLAALVGFIGAEMYLVWQNHLSVRWENNHFFIYAMLGVVFSEIFYRSWKFVRGSLNLNTFE